MSESSEQTTMKYCLDKKIFTKCMLKYLWSLEEALPWCIFSARMLEYVDQAPHKKLTSCT